MAIVKAVRGEPVAPPPLKGVTLELTQKEAQVIRDLVGAVRQTLFTIKTGY